MTMFGADVDALRGLSSSLRRRRHDIDASRARLASIVETLPWSGPDHDRFVDEWRRVHAPAMASIVTAMTEAAARAAYHADRQDDASRRR
jgi:uncharacterized protein YukE